MTRVANAPRALDRVTGVRLTLEQHQDLAGRFGPWLHETREGLGFSIRGIARVTGIDHTRIHRFERGAAYPRYDEAILIMRILAPEPPRTAYATVGSSVR